MLSFRKYLSQGFSNHFGWSTKRKIVVIESDDWGSIRMPSKDAFDLITRSGIDMISDEGFIYNKYDSLATRADFSSLFEVLSCYPDSTGRPAVFNPISVVANPDFDKIRQEGFNEYYYEPFTTTLKRYPGCDNSFSMWKEGIDKRLFIPQFHGREHLNVQVWMKALKRNNEKARVAFDNNLWGISTANDPDIGVEFQAAFDFIEPNDVKYHKEVIKTGLTLFEDIFGYRASYFVPPNGPFSLGLQKTCFTEGIRYISVPRVQIEPLGRGKSRRRLHWLGQRSRPGITFLTRNCFFEPSQPGKDWVSSCLSDISRAFKWNKPAVVSTHRVNYIGALEFHNRENGLKQLGKLLNSIVEKWPEVEFLTSDELGGMITND